MMKWAGFTPHRGFLLGASTSRSASLRRANVSADCTAASRIAAWTSDRCLSDVLVTAASRALSV